jgi:hypothetical protein
MTEARPGATTPAGPGRASPIRGAGYWRRLGPGIVTGAAAVMAVLSLLAVLP